MSFEVPHEEINPRLHSFQEDMAKLKEEMKTKQIAHLDAVDPRELTEEDRRVYKEVSAGVLEELPQEYATSVFGGTSASRRDFAAYLNNLLMIQQGQKYLKDDEGDWDDSEK